MKCLRGYQGITFVFERAIKIGTCDYLVGVADYLEKETSLFADVSLFSDALLFASASRLQ